MKINIPDNIQYENQINTYINGESVKPSSSPFVTTVATW